jgi:hypothetical protein
MITKKIYMKNYLTLKNLGWLICVVVAMMLGMGAISKLMGTAEMVGNFQYLKLDNYLTLIGGLELLGVIMGGAVAMHLSAMGGAGVISPVMFGLLAWGGHCLRKYTTIKF